MAHELYKLADGRDSMAYDLAGGVPWHKKGQVWLPDDDMETRVKKAGMDFKFKSSPEIYTTEDGEVFVNTDRQVIYRDDTFERMSNTHKSYKIVQPREIIEFFQKWCDAGDMTLETAGTLKSGRIQWAMAKIKKSTDLNVTSNPAFKDLVDYYALLTTSIDTTLSSTGRLTRVRVVCWNTLSAAYGSGDNITKVSHRTAFDEAAQEKIRKGMEGVYEDIEKESKDTKAMASASVTPQDAVGFFLSLYAKENEDGTVDISSLSPKKVDQLFTAYKSSPGSNLPSAKDTLWGCVNAVTYAVDHNPNARTDDGKLYNAWFGEGESLKNKARDLATNVVNEKVSHKLLDTIMNRMQETDQAEQILKVVNA